MIKQKKEVKRCSKCRAPLLTQEDRDRGICPACMYKMNNEVLSQPRRVPETPKSPQSKKPSGKPSIKAAPNPVPSTPKPSSSSGKPSSGKSVAYTTKLAPEQGDFLEEYARKNGITLSELIRSVLLEWMETMK